MWSTVGWGELGWEGVPVAKAWSWWVVRHDEWYEWYMWGAGGGVKIADTGDHRGERASRHGGWWERGLGQGLSVFLDKFVWTLSEH